MSSRRYAQVVAGTTSATRFASLCRSHYWVSSSYRRCLQAQSPYDPTQLDAGHALAPSSRAHPFGTDAFGRDVLSRLIYGSRASLEISFGSTAVACVVGTTLGLLGGYFSGLMEIATVRIADIVLCFPPIVLALLVVTLLGPGVATLVLVIAILYVPTFARITYGQVLSTKRMEYVEAMHAVGAGHLRILLRTILPNVSAPIIVQCSLTMAAAILLESGLSFLGLGVVPPTPSWGFMIGEARGYMLQDPWALVWPCLALVVTIMAMNSFGDVLQDWLDPRLRPRAAARRTG